MKITRHAATGLLVAALAASLTGCSADEHPDQAVCVDPRTARVLPADYCATPRQNASWYYVPYSTWHDSTQGNRHYYDTGRRITGGSTVRPTPKGDRPVSVHYAGQKKVTVYAPAKQPGIPVKVNQDARKPTTVTPKKSTVFGRSSGSTSKSFSRSTR